MLPTFFHHKKAVLWPYFLQAGCPSCRPTNSVKALPHCDERETKNLNVNWIGLLVSHAAKSCTVANTNWLACFYNIFLLHTLHEQNSWKHKCLSAETTVNYLGWNEFKLELSTSASISTASTYNYKIQTWSTSTQHYSALQLSSAVTMQQERGCSTSYNYISNYSRRNMYTQSMAALKNCYNKILL